MPYLTCLQNPEYGGLELSQAYWHVAWSFILFPLRQNCLKCYFNMVKNSFSWRHHIGHLLQKGCPCFDQSRNGRETWGTPKKYLEKWVKHADLLCCSTIISMIYFQKVCVFMSKGMCYKKSWCAFTLTGKVMAPSLKVGACQNVYTKPVSL